MNNTIQILEQILDEIKVKQDIKASDKDLLFDEKSLGFRNGLSCASIIIRKHLDAIKHN